MSSKHKSHSLDKECLCSKCPLRFFCFTEERVFSDPIYQGLFEALMAQGKSREEALGEVTEEIKFRIAKPSNSIFLDPPGMMPNSTAVPWAVGDAYDSGYVSFGVNDSGKTLINYTMHDGEEVSWACD